MIFLHCGSLITILLWFTHFLELGNSYDRSLITFFVVMDSRVKRIGSQSDRIIINTQWLNKIITNFSNNIFCTETMVVCGQLLILKLESEITSLRLRCLIRGLFGLDWKLFCLIICWLFAQGVVCECVCCSFVKI